MREFVNARFRNTGDGWETLMASGDVQMQKGESNGDSERWHTGNADPRRWDRPGDHGRRRRDPGRARFAVRVGQAARRDGGDRGCRRSAAAGAAGEHPPHEACLEGPARHAGGRRLPLGERAPTRGVPALRQPPPGAHHRPRRALRQHRPRARAREPGGPVRRLRALHPDRGRPARGGDLLGGQHARRLAAHRRVRLRLRGEARPQEGHHRPQGERAQGADRGLPRDSARGGEEV